MQYSKSTAHQQAAGERLSPRRRRSGGPALGPSQRKVSAAAAAHEGRKEHVRNSPKHSAAAAPAAWAYPPGRLVVHNLCRRVSGAAGCGCCGGAAGAHRRLRGGG